LGIKSSEQETESVMLWRKSGGKFLTASLAPFAVMMVLAGTPVLWILTGRQSETYPELVALGIGVPVSLLFVLAAGIRFWLKNRTAL
jgi:hypothetical protein